MLVSRLVVIGAAAVLLAPPLATQQWLNAPPSPRTNQSTFRALEDWPAPNEQRNAAGHPGPKYWQQRVDYVIKASLDTVKQAVTGTERITYHNNSPDRLGYLWFQLDQNVDAADKRSRARDAEPAVARTLSPAMQKFLLAEEFQGGHTLTRVQLVGAGGRLTDARYTVNGTELKVWLAEPLAPGKTATVDIDWHFNVPEAGRNDRGVKEKVRDGWLYEISQWFPRAAVYDDVNGWQTDQFLGQGEFYLNFGSYDVSITVPHDHIVQATGVLVNPEQTMTATQRARLATALKGETPVFIIRADEVKSPASRPAGTTPITWHFRAENVRDFAFVSSSTYVWDAAGFSYRPGGRVIELHSLYPRDAMPLWDKVSTKAIAQTMRSYGRMAFEYPYPKASNIHGPVFGMEYPMIAFCGARPAADGTVDANLERSLVSVTIHEVGHNWFPMIVASDERKWTWMDEGVNSFLQYYAEQDWQKGYPSRRGPARNIVDYMRDTNQVPIMTESEEIHRGFGNNGYGKPAAGLVMLREQIVGAGMFDQAFREYAQQWMFKHPQPADFFRSVEDGAGEQLNFFWRGWFYGTYANDQAIASVDAQSADSLVGNSSRGSRYYRIAIENRGGLLLPVKMLVTFDDGTTQRIDLPVDIWRKNEKSFVHGFFTSRTVTQVVLDPDEALADVDRSNNTWRAGAPRAPIS